MSDIGHNIIGDIHGRDCWKRFVDDNLINVFIGDFLDPYTYSISFDDCKHNFLEIIDYKKQHPDKTILLWGNHELHYLLQRELDERYSRFDYKNCDEIERILEDNSCYFSGVAYSIGDEYLVTHAGVSRYWYMRWFGAYNGERLDTVAEEINNLWNLNRRAFSVQGNGTFPYDQDSVTQSPLWVRSWVLEKCNLFENTSYRQVFGHTQCSRIREHNGLICIDCLGNVARCENTTPMTLKIQTIL